MPPEANPDTALCSTCHRPMLQDGGPGGECVRCLFAAALLPDDMLPGSEPPVPTGTADHHRYGQFEILTTEEGAFQELGAGAMGVTYRAQDCVLHRPVALKVISRSYAGDAVTRARFLREARSAAQLRHVNVASVHHYGEQDGQCFYAMELVEGETLEARVRREGPLPALLALEITLQVARALAAAETQGIVHRDLKPSNVMLVSTAAEHPDGAPVLAKVIDFGLAKAVTSQAQAPGGLSDTRDGFVGTPAFASPEQYARDGGERIDTRSDIYSLGVTFWYLLTNKLPFIGQTLSQIHEQQVGQPLPLSQLRAAAVPAPMIALLRSMLAVAPAARPQSARELLAALTRTQKQLRTASPAARIVRWSGALTALMLLAVGLALWREHRRPPDAQVDHSLAVLPFENLSPDPADAFFTTGVQDEITTGLSRVADLKIASPSSTKNFPVGQRDLSAIGQQLGVTHLLEGSCRRENDRFEVRLRLVDLHHPAHPWTQQYGRTLADLTAVETEIARTVSTQLGARLSPAESIAIQQPPTRDPVAYDLYLRARDKRMVFGNGDDPHRSVERCITLLEQAVARDPQFVRAYCQLVEEHDYFIKKPEDPKPGEQSVDHLALSEDALRKARELAPAAGEVHLATARHLESVGDYPAAAEEADLARRLLPNSHLAEYTAGSLAGRTGHWDRAIPCLEKAVTLNPLDLINLYSLGDAYSYARRDDDAERVYGRLLERLSDKDRGELVLQFALRKLGAKGDLTPLRAALDQMATANDPDGGLQYKYGLVLQLFSDNPDGADRVLALGKGKEFEDSGFVYPRGWFEGLVARMRHDPTAMRRAFESARPDIEEQLAAKTRTGGFRLSFLALVDAGLGHKEDAVREALQACELTPYETHAIYAPAVRCNLATVYAWTGQPDEALAVLGKAVERFTGDAVVLQPTYGDLKMNPVWEELRADPRFAACIQKLAPAQKP